MIEIISYIASICLLSGWGITKKSMKLASSLNLIGSILMSVYGFSIKAYALPLLNIPYGVISLYYLIKEIKVNAKDKDKRMD